MTIEQICKVSASELEAMTDKQLAEWALPFLRITRPELAPKPEKKILHYRNSTTVQDAKKQKAAQLIAQFGLNPKDYL